jgi:arylsulfatase A-like enzyme
VDTSGLTRRELLRAGTAGAAGVAVLGAAGCDLFGDEDGGTAGAQGPERPNILVVMIDSFRTDHVGAYGGRRAFTANLNALARESLVFTHAVPEAMPTIPARRAMMTGRRSFPFRGWHPVPGLPPQPGWSPIPRSQVTWTELLRRRGYVTGYVTDNPHILARPYDRFRAIFDAARTVKGQVPFRGTPRGHMSRAAYLRYVPPELRDTDSGRLKTFLEANKGMRGEDNHLTARVFNTGVAFLQTVSQRQPFALVVDSFNPHEPWDPPPKYTALYTDIGRKDVKPIQPFNSPGGKVSDMSRRTHRRAKGLYAGELSFVDTWLGNLLDTLDALGMAENTWVIVLGDHGVLLGEHGWMGKPRSLAHREVYRVPYMIRHPGGRRAGARSGYYASTHDVATTALSAAGIRPGRAMHGADLTAFFEGRRPRSRPHFTSAFNEYIIVGDGRWVMISDNQLQEPRLYDKRRDPRELHDVASAHPAVVRRLYAKARRDAGGRFPRL